MRGLIRRGEYSLTAHSERRLDAHQLSVLDVERVVLAGFVAEHQRDSASGEWKYVIEGPTTRGEWAVVVAKISKAGKLWVLTAFRL